MSLERSFQQLQLELSRLLESLAALHLTVTEDKPRHDETVLVDCLDNTVTELISTTEETNALIASRLKTMFRDSSAAQTNQLLRNVQSLLIQFKDKYFCELASHDSIARLFQMGEERGRAWKQWAQAVKTAVDGCIAPLRAVELALLECWTELSDQLSKGFSAVPATQQMMLKDDKHQFATSDN